MDSGSGDTGARYWDNAAAADRKVDSNSDAAKGDNDAGNWCCWQKSG